MKQLRALSIPADWSAGIRQGVLLGAAILVTTLPPTGLATSRLSSLPALPQSGSVSYTPNRVADFGDHVASADARFVANWVARSSDNQRLPFVILDKRDARVFVFDRSGMLIDASRTVHQSARSQCLG